MRVRIVVADQTEARFYDALGYGRTLVEQGVLRNPSGRAHERDLVSDRPGRVFERAADAHRRRGASARHSSGSERTARRHTVEVFARRIGAELDRARRARRYEALVLVAGPAFLGRLRAALPAAVRALVSTTVPKDVVHQAPAELRAYLPRSVFTGVPAFEPAKRAAPGG